MKKPNWIYSIVHVVPNRVGELSLSYCQSKYTIIWKEILSLMFIAENSCLKGPYSHSQARESSKSS